MKIKYDRDFFCVFFWQIDVQKIPLGIRTILQVVNARDFRNFAVKSCILFFSVFHGFLCKFQCQSDVFLMCSQNNSSSDFFLLL